MWQEGLRSRKVLLMLLPSCHIFFPLVLSLLASGYLAKDDSGPGNIYRRWPPARINPDIHPPKLPSVNPNPITDLSSAWKTTEFVMFMSFINSIRLMYYSTLRPLSVDEMMTNCSMDSCKSFSSICPKLPGMPFDNNGTTVFSWTLWNTTQQTLASKCEGLESSPVTSTLNPTKTPYLSAYSSPGNPPPNPSIHNLPICPSFIKL